MSFNEKKCKAFCDRLFFGLLGFLILASLTMGGHAVYRVLTQ